MKNIWKNYLNDITDSEKYMIVEMVVNGRKHLNFIFETNGYFIIYESFGIGFSTEQLDSYFITKDNFPIEMAKTDSKFIEKFWYDENEIEDGADYRNK